MTIDADVLAIARHFGIDAGLIQAVVNAEGNIVKAVQCSIPTITTRADALDVLCRSAVHALSDFVKNGDENAQFVQFWAQRWAPVGATNDPANLNANWAHNVSALWLAGKATPPRFT